MEAVTNVELAELLVQAVQHFANYVVEFLLMVRPQCYVLPPQGHDHQSLVCIAASVGNLGAVKLLLACYTEVEKPSLIDDAECSLAITGLDPALDDVYISEPFLSYNLYSVYIGLVHGLYLYYFVPSDEQQYPSGWCISAHLGDGRPAFRLELDEGPLMRLLDQGFSSATVSRGASRLRSKNSSAGSRQSLGPQVCALGCAVAAVCVGATQKETQPDGMSHRGVRRPGEVCCGGWHTRAGLLTSALHSPPSPGLARGRKQGLHASYRGVTGTVIPPGPLLGVNHQIPRTAKDHVGTFSHL